MRTIFTFQILAILMAFQVNLLAQQKVSLMVNSNTIVAQIGDKTVCMTYGDHTEYSVENECMNINIHNMESNENTLNKSFYTENKINTPPKTLSILKEEESYVDDIPFDTEQIASENHAIFPYYAEEEEYVDDIPMDIQKIATEKLR